MSATPKIEVLKVALDHLVVPKDMPSKKDPRVTALVESIGEVGLLNPLTVLMPGFKLRAGRHRFVALRVLGESHALIRQVSGDDLKGELITIDENLVRRELSALERAEQIARRKEIYETLHPTTKHGAAPKGADREKTKPVSSFAADTADKTGVTERSVQQYVQVAKRLDPEVKAKLKEAGAADSIKELTKLARLTPEKQRQVVDRMAKGASVKAATREVKREEQVAQVRAHVPPVGEFEVIAIDPPWDFDDKLDGSDAARGATPYPTMKIAEIAALSIPVAKDCCVFLWVTNAHLIDPDAYAVVVRAWRDRYGLIPKQIRTWRKPKMGLGRGWRNTTEHLVRLERGGPVLTGVTQTTDFEAPVGKHSEKPQRAYDDIEALWAATSRLEMFARADRAGWVTNGAEAPKVAARRRLPPIVDVEAEA